MLSYDGSKCLICQEELKATEDIVVCPECGTPYHRECYRSAGKCVNEALHASGGSWQKERAAEIKQQRRDEKRAEEAEQAAERERGEGPQVFYGELYDGVRLNPDAPCAGLDPSEECDGVTMGELSNFVAVNRLYYLPLFRLMKKTGKHTTLNLSSLLFPHLYFANRKMWAMTLLSIFLRLVLRLPSWMEFMAREMGYPVHGLNVDSSAFSGIVKAATITGICLSLLAGAFANYWYYRFSVRKIKAYKKNAASDEALQTTLKAEGGTNLGNMFLAFIIDTVTSVLTIIFLMIY